ncbi:MAG: TIGR03790 family protein [Candidatus Didemnitutus sp.]|nr:TIGR03790 family protein [Candidatus Didemnitutus sp.]
MNSLLRTLGLLVLLATVAHAAADDLAARTVVLVNARQPESVALGEFYAAKRGIPAANLIALPMPAEETITWRTFVDFIWQPLQDELLRRNWLEGYLSEKLDALGRRRAALTGHKLAYLVLCRGTPLRIDNDPTTFDERMASRLQKEFRTTGAAVDSELALIAQNNPPNLGPLQNPLFGAQRASEISAELVVKTARLDGPSDSAARNLVTSALEAEQQGLLGRYYVDLGGPHANGDRWLEATRDQLVNLGFPGDVQSGSGMFDVTDRFDAPVLYFGWYAMTVNGPFARPDFRFPPGAIALHIHSVSAASLRTTTDYWCGPLLAHGVTATFGNVFEPYLEFTIRPQLLLAELARGKTLGDAAWFATPALSWQTIILGDPLYRPFKVGLDEQVRNLANVPHTLAGYAIARKVIVLDRLGLDDEARELLARGMREQPSVPLALAAARYEIAHNRPAAAVAVLAFMPNLPPASSGEWPLVKLAAELVAAHGTAREALPFFELLVRSNAPTPDAQLRALQEARRVADAAGDMTRSLEFARRAAGLLPAAAPTAPK